MRLHFILAAIAALAAVPASAACEVDRGTELKLKAKAVSDAGWARDETLVFTNYVVTSQGGAPATALFAALGDPACATVTLIAGERGPVQVKHPTGEAGELFELLALTPQIAADRVGKLWDQGYDGLRNMALLHASTPTGKRVVETVVMRKLNDIWLPARDSRPDAPFRQALKTRYDLVMVPSADPRIAAIIRSALFQSAKTVDRSWNNEVPEDSYIYLQPEA